MKRKAVILGATGMVGQRFISLLENHPQFEVAVLAASEKSAGKKYKDAAKWVLDERMPEGMGEKEVIMCNPQEVKKIDSEAEIVFSSLPGEIAGKVEEDFAREGFAVFSKAANHRMEEDVPLIIPEVNPEQLELIEMQRRKRGWKGNGFISTDPNCTTTQLAISLKPLHDKFGIRSMRMVSMQALSGAGYPGVASLDIIDNVIPFISGEEEKVEEEAKKLLGKMKNGKVEDAKFQISASCNRVHVKDGHLENVFLELEKGFEVEEVKKTFEEFRGEPQRLKLHSAPLQPIVVREEKDRPQPRRDREEGNGMAISVGRIRKDVFGNLKYICLGHNTIRGAAGNGILHAELAIAKKII